jgi:hypothetical protein
MDYFIESIGIHKALLIIIIKGLMKTAKMCL